MEARRATWLLALVVSAGCSQTSAAPATPSSEAEDISFLSIVVDPETAAADTRLKRFLERAVAKGLNTGPAQRTIRFPQQTMPYGDVIRAFAEREPGRAYLARITPYAYVAAEMLGAKLRILATYKSKATGNTTYHSYFVVRRQDFQQHTTWKPEIGLPNLGHVKTYLENLNAADRPARFIYHDRFSTSSYFLPSLYFKTHDIFAMAQSINANLVPIDVERVQSTSSSDLVTRIKSGADADVAAVWDGTKSKFKPEDNADLLFIRIPTPVPNDFLVASGVREETEARILEAIRNDPAAGRVCTDLKESVLPSESATARRPRCDVLAQSEEHKGNIPKDDFDSWYVWDSNDSEVTDGAKEALARLRQDARFRPTPVVVKVQANFADLDERERRLLAEYVDAAKEAVRLSGTELVLEDADLHKRVDMTWTLQSTHDGALKLTSTLDSAFKESKEEFAISFVDRSDLPQRIADLARSRLRRIRYVWPYEQKYVAVLRDLDFTPDHWVQVQRISWIDVRRNEYEEDTPFAARIENNTDFNKFRLSDEVKFPRNADGSFNFDPLSNVAYRVVIARQPQAGWIWVALPYCFVGLFVLACAGAVVDVRRQQPPPCGLQQTYQRLVDDYHEGWHSAHVEEGEIIWWDEKYLDNFVKEVKTTGSFFDIVQTGGCDFNVGPLPIKLSLLIQLGSRLIYRRSVLATELAGASEIGHVAALDTLVHFLVHRRRLSGFVGFPESIDGSKTPPWPLEWEALNRIASKHFEQLGVCDKPVVDVTAGRGNGALANVVSSHFRSVIKKATRDASLFQQTWTVSEDGTPNRLFCAGDLRTALLLRDEHGSAGQATSVRLEVQLPPDAALAATSDDGTLRAWVCGKILKWSVEHGCLVLQLKPIAILNDYAHQH